MTKDYSPQGIKEALDILVWFHSHTECFGHGDYRQVATLNDKGISMLLEILNNPEPFKEKIEKRIEEREKKVEEQALASFLVFGFEVDWMNLEHRKRAAKVVTRKIRDRVIGDEAMEGCANW